MPVKTFTFKGSHLLVDRQMPVKTLPYDGKYVWGGMSPGGNLAPPYGFVKFSRKLHESMVYALNIFFQKYQLPRYFTKHPVGCQWHI